MFIFIVTHIWSKYIISRKIIIKKGNIYTYRYMHGKFLITSLKKGGGLGRNLIRLSPAVLRKKGTKCIFLLQQAASVVEAFNGMWNDTKYMVELDFNPSVAICTSCVLYSSCCFSRNLSASHFKWAAFFTLCHMHSAGRLNDWSIYSTRKRSQLKSL